MLISKKKSETKKGAPEQSGTPLPSAGEIEEARAAEQPEKKSRKVLPEDLGLSFTDGMTPLNDAEGATWTFRHPDMDGSGFKGRVTLTNGAILESERGYVTTKKKEERAALERMGWILWHTEVTDARIARHARTF